MNQNLTLSDYIKLDEKIDKNNEAASASYRDDKVIRVALLGSFTLNGIKEVLNSKCDETGIVLKSYVGEYNQYAQELLDKDSGLYQFKADLTVLLIDVRDMLGEYYYFPYRLNDRGKRKLFVRKRIRELLNLIRTFKRTSKGKLLLHNFSVPVYSPMGIMETKQEFGFFEMVRYLNRSLEDALRHDSQAYIFDYDNFLTKYGKINCVDEKMYYLADMRLSQNLIPALCAEYMRYIRIIIGKVRKCIVLDLDNTLWGGIVGEDGFDGIKLGPVPPGNSFMEFQKYLLGLFERGVVLAVNSNNNEEEALRVIREHPHMVLKEDNFAFLAINWNDKAHNIIEIAKNINIGLDSLIYIDDDKGNRQVVREMLPQVFVLDLPGDPALYVNAIRECDQLDTLQITQEDSARGIMYAQERKRKESEKTFANISDYLAHLSIKIEIGKANSFSIPRLSQLMQRTNQFNFTTRRLPEEEIAHMVSRKNYKVYSIAVRDKFGDNGICGMISAKRERGYLIVDNFLLSCRILGKGIEKSVAAFLKDIAHKAGSTHILFEYIPTEKNSVVRKFLNDACFKRMKTPKEAGGTEWWRFDINKGYDRPKHIEVIMK